MNFRRWGQDGQTDAIQLAGTVPCVLLREEGKWRGKTANLFMWPNVEYFMQNIHGTKSNSIYFFPLCSVASRHRFADGNQNVNNGHACALNTSSICCMGGTHTHTHGHSVARLSDCSMFIWRSERVACRHFINCCAAVAEVRIVCASISYRYVRARVLADRIIANSHRWRRTRENNEMPTRNWLKMQLCSRTRTSHIASCA